MEPQLRKAYLVGGVLGFAAGVTVLAISIFLFPGLILDLIGPQDEEERPPVVVSSGSVDIEVPNASRGPGHMPVPPNKKGRFQSITGALVYRHTGNNPNNDKSVTAMDLLINGASSCQAPVMNLTAFTIVTTNGEIKVSIKPRGGAGSKQDVSFEFTTNAMNPVNHKLVLSDPHKLQAVTFIRGGLPAICAFDAASAADHWFEIAAR
jgi:hypothetical protein